MKKVKLFLLINLVICLLISLTSCGIFNNQGKKDNTEEFNDELTSSTGRWNLMGDDTTYFIFNGTKNKMTLEYYEESTLKYSGTFRVVYRGNGKDVVTPLTFIITRTDKEKEDWLGCYVDNFKEDFTQFTIMYMEEDLGMIDATIHTHLYRINEMPYKLGTYILESKTYKEEANNYKYANELSIPSGTYELNENTSITFLMTKPTTSYPFMYQHNDTVIYGYVQIAYDTKSLYLYIDHDPYEKVINDDKKYYDTSFSLYYPPNFYLRGEFNHHDKLIINDLYHHTEDRTGIDEGIFVFGTYNKK